MRLMPRSGRWIVALLVSLASLSPVLAQDALDPRDRELLGEPQGPPLSGEELATATEEVASLMRCPVCQGLSVADSHTPSALAMRAKAEALLAAGYGQDQVLAYFESSYGEFIRLSPRPEGFNLVVWILPGLGLLVGALVVWRRVRLRPAAAPLLAAAGAEEDDRGDETEAAADDDQLAAYRERVRREAGS